MDQPLAGKTALITGSTSGLGREMAEAFGRAGCRVALNGFGAPAEIENLISETTAHLGPIDILINNAGMQFVSPLESFPAEKWDAILALNLSAAFHTTKLVLPGMRQRRWGRIINISSAHGLVASPFKSAYVAAKHGLIGLTKVTALETARDGITCNALCPGFIHTPIVEGQIDEQARATGIPREKVIEEIILAKHATKEFVRADQVAVFALMLCTEAGSSTTGAAIPIDGGWTAA